MSTAFCHIKTDILCLSRYNSTKKDSYNENWKVRVLILYRWLVNDTAQNLFLVIDQLNCLNVSDI